MCTDEHTCTKHTREFMHYNHSTIRTEFPFCAFHCPSVEKHLYSRTSDLEAGLWIEMWELGATNFALSNFVGEEIKKRWSPYGKFWLNRKKVLHLMRNEGEIMEGMADGEKNEEVRVVREGRAWALKISKTQNASSARRAGKLPDWDSKPRRCLWCRSEFLFLPGDPVLLSSKFSHGTIVPLSAQEGNLWFFFLETRVRGCQVHSPGCWLRVRLYTDLEGSSPVVCGPGGKAPLTTRWGGIFNSPGPSSLLMTSRPRVPGFQCNKIGIRK